MKKSYYPYSSPHKLLRSNAAHDRLFLKHIVKFDRDSQIKSEYHKNVLACQRKSGKLLSRGEKKTLYNYEHNRVYGDSKEKGLSRSYLEIMRQYGVDSF